MIDNQLNCVIIDDEYKDRENLRLLINLYNPNVNIIGEACDEPSIIDVLSNTKPDLVFVDIQLGSISIFEVLNKLEKISFNIVFVTAYSKYAIKGYKYNAIDYLLKPVDPKRLQEVVDKAIQLKLNYTKTQKANPNLEETQKKIIASPTLSLTDSNGVHIVKIEDIFYCKSDGNYTEFILKNEKKTVISKTLKHFETQLIPYNFFRIHKSYLINLDKVDFITKKQSSYVVMKNGKSLPVSRRTKRHLYNKMNII